MGRRILVINGHPDPSPERLSAALCAAYARGAASAGHEIRRLDLGAMDLPMLRSAAEFDRPPDGDAAAAQAAVSWCEHLVLVFPLWLGGPPALVKAFFEQTFRYGFAIPAGGGPALPRGLLRGRSARLIVTMGMPAPAYRLGFGAFGVRAIERSILWLSGFRPIRRTLIGGVGNPARQIGARLEKIAKLGASAA